MWWELRAGGFLGREDRRRTVGKAVEEHLADCELFQIHDQVTVLLSYVSKTQEVSNTYREEVKYDIEGRFDIEKKVKMRFEERI